MPADQASSRPPLRWQPICEESGLYVIERPRPFPLRTTALRLRDGGTLLISPSRHLGEEAHGQLRALGEPRFLLAPNHFHHLGLGEHLSRYPAATVVASGVARPRLSARVSAQVGELAPLRAALPAHAELLEPPGLKNGEVWLSVRTRRGLALVVSDAFFNLPQHVGGLIGLFCRLTGVTAGLRIGGTFLLVGIGDRPAYRTWLKARLEAAPPRILVPGHGEVVEDEGLGQRLLELATRRLG
jgi:glyoxylase-like metal-dependent hydrolase (beta-lactamase superfamily II)